MQQYAGSPKLFFYKNALIKIAAVITAASLIIYAVIRLLFAGYNISLKEDLVNLFYIIRLSAILSTVGFVLFLFIEAADEFKSKLKWRLVLSVAARTAMVVLFVLVSFKLKIVSGFKKYLSAGMVTKCSNVE